MSKHLPHRHVGGEELLPGERLLRAVVDIDRQLEEYRQASRPVPLDLHRAKRILKAALLRCGIPNRPLFEQ